MRFVAVITLLAAVGQAQAGFVQWSTADGGNGHFYGLVMPDSLSGSYSWSQARDAAANMVFEGSHGHLATVTSKAENDFLYAAFGSQITPDYALIGGAKGDQVWIGLTDFDHIGNWQWITGEPFSYSNWAPPEPNFLDFEFYGLYWRRDYGSGPLWSWNNAADQPFDLNLTRYGFLVEFDGPFSVVPAPSTLLLAGFGVLGLLAYSWNRAKSLSEVGSGIPA